MNYATSLGKILRDFNVLNQKTDCIIALGNSEIFQHDDSGDEPRPTR